MKKICSLMAATTVLCTAFSFAACKDESYKGTPLEYQSSDAVAIGNGGFAVEKGGYVYFINGMEENTAKNSYGDVVKGALMRISRSNLDEGKYDKVETVVPMLFVAKDYQSGIYIYGDYVYYATPTTSKNIKGGAVENSYIDFKRAKLDGSEAMKDYYFRLSDNASSYRFVQAGENNTVYCLYEKDSDLYSYNTVTGDTYMLVKDASDYYYDTDNLSNPNVYYTMSVTKGIDTERPETETYNQLYVVNAAATATANASEASYTVTGGKKYDFDKAGIKKNNETATEKTEFDKYSTYPYVNLGTLVLDGIGSLSEATQYNATAVEGVTPAEPDGYTYTVRYYKNGGIYFTRSDSKALCYLPAELGNDWNCVSGNSKHSVVALDSTVNATDAAIFTIDENGKHGYIYLLDTTLYKAEVNADGTAKVVPMAYELATDITLWKTNGDYLYYYGAGTRDRSLNRINYTGTEEHYSNIDPLRGGDEYKPLTISYVDLNDDWYQPEFFGNTLLYTNAQYFGQGATAYNYVYAVTLGETAELKANSEAYQEVLDEIESHDGDADLRNAMTYYFRTGEATKFDAAVVKELYDENQTKAFDEFEAKFAEGKAFAGRYESSYMHLLGKQSAADLEKIDADWELSILQEEAVEDESGLPVWAICLIVVGSVLVVAAAVTIPLVIVHKKKVAKRKEEEATVNAYKRQKIDTTDDKTIDVYETETKENAEEAEETVEETPVEEAVEESETANE